MTCTSPLRRRCFGTSSSDRCRPGIAVRHTPGPVTVVLQLLCLEAPSTGCVKHCQGPRATPGVRRWGTELQRGPQRVLWACCPRAHAGRKDRWLAHRDMLPACPFLSRCKPVPRSGPFAALYKLAPLCSSPGPIAQKFLATVSAPSWRPSNCSAALSPWVCPFQGFHDEGAALAVVWGWLPRGCAVGPSVLLEAGAPVCRLLVYHFPTEQSL